jgi:hypothetical protein
MEILSVTVYNKLISRNEEARACMISALTSDTSGSELTPSRTLPVPPFSGDVKSSSRSSALCESDVSMSILTSAIVLPVACGMFATCVRLRSSRGGAACGGAPMPSWGWPCCGTAARTACQTGLKTDVDDDAELRDHWLAHGSKETRTRHQDELVTGRQCSTAETASGHALPG